MDKPGKWEVFTMSQLSNKIVKDEENKVTRDVNHFRRWTLWLEKKEDGAF